MRGRTWIGVLPLLAWAVIAMIPASASAEPPIFWQSEVGESVPGARGVATNPTNGHVFVTDQEGYRVVEFTAWGALVKMWGWDVVESGPGDTAPANEFEICVPANGDKCKDGTPGTGGGQLTTAMGIAVDSVGNVYVAETSTSHRVQKFSPAGQFLLAFGKEGTGPGEFSSSESVRTEIAITLDDKVWVADNERIQRFNTAGVYQDQLNVPGENINSLAVDAAGNLYAAYSLDIFESKEDVRKLNPSTGEVLVTFKAKNPRGIAVSSNGDVYVFDKDALGPTVPRIRHFDPTGKEIEAFGGEALKGLLAGGLATSSACGIDGTDLFLAVERPRPTLVRAYGATPDPDICPQPQVPPDITAQYATAVGTDSAALEARISPNFFDDGTYYLEYGTVDCAVGPCEAVLFPGAPLTSEITNEALAAHADVEGLEPDTTYHFRFVAQSGGGGPVFGPDSTFTTRRVPTTNPDDCANKGLRVGTAAALPDCRAYEMVSPPDKNGGDTTAYFYEGLDASFKFDGLDQSTPEGAKLTYTASSLFADPEGSPAYAQYISTRGAGGWSSESIDPPMEGGVANGAIGTTSQFKAFSADLCQGWLIPESGVPLTPGPTEGFRNLYRRDNCAGPPAYTWLESSAPEPEPCVNSECDSTFNILIPDLQGVARDGECAAFRVNDALAGAPKGVPGGEFTASQLYLKCEGTPVRLVSVLANGAAFKGWSSAGTETGGLGPESDGAAGEGHRDTVEHALSEDGTRIYWTASSEAFPKLYLRFNADDFLPSTEGTGDLTQIASGKGTVSKESAVITGFSTTTGTFTVGESITGLGIPVGTTILAVEAGTLTMSNPATADFSNTTLRSFSKVIGNVTTSTGSFAVGQRIFGTGIPAGATITAAGAGSLTLSIAPTTAKTGAALRATEECTAPDLPCTLQVSPQSPTDRAQFWTAGSDGTRAIFSILQGPDEGNLYEYNFDPAEGKGASTKIAGETLGVAGASEDATRIYFASEEVCSSEPNEEGDAAEEGKANLYLYETGESCAAGGLTFVGTLAKEDVSTVPNLSFPSPVTAVPRDHIARATADGEHLSFVSAAPLTGFDNLDRSSGEADREVYLYDAGTGELVCASCNPSGSRPRGADLGSAVRGPRWTAAWIPGYQHQLYGRRLITANGNRLFFNSVDALALRDVNGAQDVYQWEAAGTGDCKVTSSSFSPQNEGCVDLISSGQDSRDSEWVEASASGNDVFFRTEASLVSTDPGSIDIYDARVGGGFPEPSPPSVCEGDSCQAPPPAPGFETPSSEAFQGPGNAKPRKQRCAKGKVRRKGRCVKKHKRKGKAHHNRRAAR